MSTVAGAFAVGERVRVGNGVVAASVGVADKVTATADLASGAEAGGTGGLAAVERRVRVVDTGVHDGDGAALAEEALGVQLVDARHAVRAEGVLGHLARLEGLGRVVGHVALRSGRVGRKGARDVGGRDDRLEGRVRVAARGVDSADTGGRLQVDDVLVVVELDRETLEEVRVLVLVARRVLDALRLGRLAAGLGCLAAGRLGAGGGLGAAHVLVEGLVDVDRGNVALGARGEVQLGVLVELDNVKAGNEDGALGVGRGGLGGLAEVATRKRDGWLGGIDGRDRLWPGEQRAGGVDAAAATEVVAASAESAARVNFILKKRETSEAALSGCGGGSGERASRVRRLTRFSDV